jgi:hypothetical protein
VVVLVPDLVLRAVLVGPAEEGVRVDPEQAAKETQQELQALPMVVEALAERLQIMSVTQLIMPDRDWLMLSQDHLHTMLLVVQVSVLI